MKKIIASLAALLIISPSFALAFSGAPYTALDTDIIDDIIVCTANPVHVIEFYDGSGNPLQSEPCSGGNNTFGQGMLSGGNTYSIIEYNDLLDVGDFSTMSFDDAKLDAGYVDDSTVDVSLAPPPPPPTPTPGEVIGNPVLSAAGNLIGGSLSSLYTFFIKYGLPMIFVFAVYAFSRALFKGGNPPGKIPSGAPHRTRRISHRPK